ncbi:succinate dehydrogenase, cytochrome b556 subunit [Kaarinaea lacus]
MKTMINRPIYLNLFKIHFPVAAVVSILHRFSGVLFSLLTPLVIYLFGLSIEGEQSFSRVVSLFSSMPGKLITAILVWIFAHHFLAGVRFLLIDIDIGLSKSSAAQSAWLVHIGAVAMAALALGLML